MHEISYSLFKKIRLKFIITTILHTFLTSNLMANNETHILLKADGWTPRVREQLDRIILEGAGQKLPVVFDLDETLIARDIADAAFGVLVRDGYMTKETIPSIFAPPLRVNGQTLTLNQAIDLTEYGEWLLHSTRLQADDPAPNSCFFEWVVQIMAGLTCDQVVEATARGYEDGIGSLDEFQYPGDSKIWVTPPKTGFLKPFFRFQMVELVGELLDHGYDVWVVSASNVLMVRWAMMKVFNQLLEEQGFSGRVLSDHIIGMSALLQDEQGNLFKDYPLVNNDKGYQEMDGEALKRYQLTSILVPPITAYSGKVAAIMERIGCYPYLGVGDSLSDHPFLKRSFHKLWMAKLESWELQQDAVESIGNEDKQSWMVQPVLSKKAPCLVSELNVLSELFPSSSEIEPLFHSWQILQEAELLPPINKIIDNSL